MDGVVREHIPDYLMVINDGPVVVDVKPPHRLSRPEVAHMPVNSELHGATIPEIRRPSRPPRRGSRAYQGTGRSVMLMSKARRTTGKPVGMPLACQISLLGRGEEDVSAPVIGIVDALHLSVGDENSRHLVVSNLTE